MPSATISPLPPQLPPLPTQPSLASPSIWKLDYPAEDINLPPSSWPASSSTSHYPLRRSNSTSPARRLHIPTEQVAGDSASRSRAGTAPSSSSSGKVHSHSHSHSRSNSRVPIPIIASASSSDLEIISPPFRTHSRSISAGFVKPPTARPSTADKEEKEKAMEALRGLPKGPKHGPPFPLPRPVRDQSLARTAFPSTTTKSAVSEVPSHLPAAVPAAPAPPTPVTPPMPFSAPPRHQGRRFHSSPKVPQSTDSDSSPDSSPGPTTPPYSAPVRKASHGHLRERKQSREDLQEKEKRHAFNYSVPEASFLDKQLPETPVRAPIRAPTPPRPRPLPLAQNVMSSHPNSSTRYKPAPSSWKPAEGAPSSSPDAVAPAPAPAVRGRTLEVALAIRTAPGVAIGANGRQDATPRKPSEGVARKWVLEKRGKRLTQDSLVVAQQLRMLR